MRYTPHIHERIAFDRTGRVLRDGDLVRHDNGQRPLGTFRIEWDPSKVGFILSGVGEIADGWLREWSPECVDLEEAAHEADVK